MNKQGGFFKIILIVVILILIVSYFGLDLKSLFENEAAKKNFAYAWQGVVYLWNNYLIKPFFYLWNDIFVNIVWNSIINAFHKIPFI